MLRLKDESYFSSGLIYEQQKGSHWEWNLCFCIEVFK